ncbi:hypothetical protein SLE2022_223380 [Rubroshorea leprosula]
MAMKKMLLVMLLLAVVQAEEFSPFETSLPSETETLLPFDTSMPSFLSKTPSTPQTPEAFFPQDSHVNPDSTCRIKCGTKCFKAKIPVIRSLCDKTCMERCKLSDLELLSKCTTSCSQSMPSIFRTDKEVTEGYVDHCYQKCMSTGTN